MSATCQPAFAVCRFDSDATRVTVKEVVWTEEKAKSEVARLNYVNGSKGCLYYYTNTQVEDKAKE